MNAQQDLLSFLRNKLPEVASHLENTNTSFKEVKRYTYQALYWIIGREGKHTCAKFPENIRQLFPGSVDQLFVNSASTDKVNDYLQYLTLGSASHAGRSCGRKFNVGEPIYRCIDCGFDNTCVLCVHCFNKEDHIGHQVSTSTCSDMNNGICDCGDPEAWTKELHCKCSQDSNADNNLNFEDDYSLYMKEIFTVCLEYVIKIMLDQCQTLPFINKQLKTPLNRSQDKEVLNLINSEVKHISSKFHQTIPEDEEDREYYLLFWNDEYHSVYEARKAIRETSGCSGEVAHSLTNAIDKEGRAIIAADRSLSKLLPKLKEANKSNLTSTIIYKADYHRQEFCKILIEWMFSMTKYPDISLQRLARHALCSALCEQYEIPHEDKSFWNSITTFEYCGLLYNNMIPVPDEKNLKSIKTDYSYTNSTRLQLLLYFDVRLWKSIRLQLHDLLIGSLGSELEYKRIASRQIVSIYQQLLVNLYFIDREPMVNAMDMISVQFLTCPTYSTDIVNFDILSVLSPASHILDLFKVESRGKPVFRFPRTSLDSSKSKRMSFKRIMRDLSFIFDKAESLEGLYSLFPFSFFCSIISSFDNALEFKRKTGDHVQSEDSEFIEYYEAYILLSEVIEYATNGDKLSKINRDTLVKCAKRLILQINSASDIKLKKFKGYDVVDFRVSTEFVGFFHPSIILLNGLLTSIISSSDDIKEIIDSDTILRLFDTSLRSVVLSAQIDSRYWIRNGASPSTQSHIYKGRNRASYGLFHEDIYTSQVSLLGSDPDRSFLNIIDRFELLKWFANEQDLDNTIYEDKVNMVVENLISFLYALLTERVNFLDFESELDKKKFKLKQHFMYHLFISPLTYSELEEEIDPELIYGSEFLEVLNQVATLSLPKSLNDEGRYSLRPEYFKLVDPLKLSAQNTDFSDGLSIISKQLAGKSGDPADIVIEPKFSKLPKFEDLGDFTRISDFAKLISKLLDYSLQKNSESFVPHVLHLLHAAIKDDENLNGKDHLIKSFLQIPICENLFSIMIFSKFSKSTKNKAGHLLEKLILKDRESVLETLISCFGEVEVIKYKEQKKSNGVNFDETEDERKRRLAKERQKKILLKMSKKQKEFLKANDEDEHDDNEIDNVLHEDTRHCVLCQGVETSSKILCAPIAVIETNVFRSLPLFDKEFIKRAFMNWGNDSIENELNAEGVPFPAFNKPEMENNIKKHQVLYSCNHAIHAECLRNYKEDNSLETLSFPCPLCKSKHDTYIPLSPAKDITQDVLNSYSESVFDTLGAYLNSEIFDQSQDSFAEANWVLSCSSTTKFEKVKSLTNLFANSVSQIEISTRINGFESYENFLQQISEQKLKVLRDLFRYAVTRYERFGKISKSRFIKNVKTRIDQQGFMNSFVYLLLWDFMDNMDYQQLCETLIKFYAEKYLRSLLNNAFKNGEYAVNFSLISEELSSELLPEFRELLKIRKNSPLSVNRSILEKFNNDDKFATKIICMLRTILLNDLRCLAISHKVIVSDFELNSSNDGDIIGKILSSLGLAGLGSILSSDENNLLFKYSGNFQDLALPYPGVIKLIDLPKELSYFSTSSKDPHKFPFDGFIENSSNRIDFVICLTCGHKVFNANHRTKLYDHFEKSYCNCTNGIFLVPQTCEVKLVSISRKIVRMKVLNAPYMNSHGQSGRKAIQNGHIATLNNERYKYFNSLWLSGDIYPFLSRNAATVPRDDDALFNQLAERGIINNNFEGLQNRATFIELLESEMPNILINTILDNANDENDDDDEDYETDDSEVSDTHPYDNEFSDDSIEEYDNGDDDFSEGTDFENSTHYFDDHYDSAEDDDYHFEFYDDGDEFNENDDELDEDSGSDNYYDDPLGMIAQFDLLNELRARAGLINDLLASSDEE